MPAVTGIQGVLLFFLLACDVPINHRIRPLRWAPAARGGRWRAPHEPHRPSSSGDQRLDAALLLAATGELVTEKSGVLNLGVEGMMLVGAVTAFASTLTTGSACWASCAAFRRRWRWR